MDQVLLSIHNGGYIFSAIVTFGFGVIVFLKGREKLVNRIYFLNNVFFSIFAVYYLLGTNSPDPATSRFFLMFSLVNLFTVVFSMHVVWEVIGLGNKLRKIIYASYFLSAALLIFFVMNPDYFLVLSRSYSYLPNFFVAGSYYWIFVSYFALVSLIFMSTLFWRWIQTTGNEKVRISYFLVAYLWAYVTGSIAFLPVFGVDANPLFSAFVGLHVIIVAYAILNYKLLDIQVIAAKAVNFTLFTVLAGLLIVVGNWANQYVASNFLDFPSWLVPLLSSIAVVIIGFLILKKIREADILKYEFINNISHKFRTPLTHIRWLSEELRAGGDEKERAQQVQQIQYATMRLFELTNLVIDVAKDQEADSIYSFVPFEINEIISDMIETHSDQIAQKHLMVKVDYSPDLPQITADKTRLLFAIQIIFENSIIYTPEGGIIHISVTFNKASKTFNFEIKDNGIGVNSDDLPNLFKKFFRSAEARLTDTEGMGIGLYMAKKIVERHNGKINAYSEGENLGTTFSFTIPERP